MASEQFLPTAKCFEHFTLFFLIVVGLRRRGLSLAPIGGCGQAVRGAVGFCITRF